METMRSKIKDPDILWAHEQIIRSAPVACPIGYYTSPWYANLYLERLDWYVEQKLYKERRGKRIKYVKHYLRYADDILLMGTSKSDLGKAISAIKDQLGDLGLELKPTWEIKRIGKHVIIDGKRRLEPNTYWCDIGGYKFCRDSTIMRDGVFLSTKRLVKKMYADEHYTPYKCKSLQAKLGWACHSDSMNFLSDSVKPYVNLKEIRKVISDVDKDGKRQREQARKDQG